MDQDHHMAMNYLGYMWAERRVSLPEAEKLILRALQFEAENPAYLDSLGWVYFQQGRYEEARTYLEKALKGLPEDPVILDHYGDVLLKLGHAEEALAAWKKALETSEEPDPIRAKIADHSKKVSLTQTPSP
jgi:tetratricopeptide (TPR) repeat protein